MYNFRNFLEELSNSSGIDLSLVSEDDSIVYNSSFERGNSDDVTFTVFLGRVRASVSIPKKYEMCIPLLKYSIEGKYREIFSIREQFIIQILEGKEVALDKVEKSIPFISKGCTVILVNVDGNRYEALNIIRQIYKDQDVLTTVYGENIIIIGCFEEVEEHAKSIKDSIISELYCKCYISLSNIVCDPENIKKAYDNAKECLMLAKRFDVKEEILDYNKLFFEKIVYNINSKVKQEVLTNFRERFNIFDNEMISTIEEFVNCDLNISDAARKLYIHRNTLIYRLDKIQKDTSFDIRNFKEATVFMIAFLIWKENR